MEDMNKVVEEIHTSIVELRREYPQETRAFMNLLQATGKPKALSVKEKELIAVALSVASKCHWCIGFHVKNAFKEGATREELIEASYVAVTMAGSPALMYMQIVLKAIKDFGSGGEKESEP